MSHKGGQPDPVKPDDVESMVGTWPNIRPPVPGFEKDQISGRNKPGWMTDGGKEINELKTELQEEYCRGMDYSS